MLFSVLPRSGFATYQRSNIRNGRHFASVELGTVETVRKGRTTKIIDPKLIDGLRAHQFDHESSLRTIVAIHNMRRRPALGGCRLGHYESDAEVLDDALRL